MAYYNNRNRTSNSGYSDYNQSNNYNSNYRSNGYNQSQGNQVQQPRKLSGSKFQVKDEKIYISAWRKNKKGFYTLFAREYKGSKFTESQSGKRWVNLFVTITNRDTMQATNTSGMYDIASKRLYIKEFNLIVTNRGRGGYFGKHISSNYNR